MTSSPLAYRWSQSEFVRAWEAGAFDHRVELVEGEIWPVVIGSWHGDTVGQLMALLPRAGARLTTADPIGRVGSRLSVWAAADVLLLVEVADDTVMQDLNIKAKVYGRAGYPVYWVVTPEAIYEHTGPIATGYRTRVEYRRGERIPVPYAGTDLAVDDLLAEPAGG